MDFGCSARSIDAPAIQAQREMRFLADENFPSNAVAKLKAAGHDIVWVRTAAPGSKDEDILALAAREERVFTLLSLLSSRPDGTAR
jgi:hypothetical protein